LSNAVRKVIEAHGLQKVLPSQLRHTGISRTSKQHNRDTARALAGHTTESTTAIYDDSDFEKMLEVALEENRVIRAKLAVGGDPLSIDRPVLRVLSGE